MRICGMLVVAIGMLMFGPANAQDSLECILFVCDEPDPTPEPEPAPDPDPVTDPAEDSGDPVSEEDVPPECAIALPEQASEQGKTSSAKGLEKANEVRGCATE